MTNDEFYELIKPSMSELLALHISLGSDSAFGATICHMITLYCEYMQEEEKRTDIDSVAFSRMLANTIKEHVEEGANNNG